MIRVPTEANTLKLSLAVCRFYSNSVDSGKPKHLRLTRLSFRTAALRRTCGVSLQSTATDLLVVPPFRLSGVYSQAFPVAAATIWNALPDSVVSASSVYSSVFPVSTEKLFWRSLCCYNIREYCRNLDYCSLYTKILINWMIDHVQ